MQSFNAQPQFPAVYRSNMAGLIGGSLEKILILPVTSLISRISEDKQPASAEHSIELGRWNFRFDFPNTTDEAAVIAGGASIRSTSTG